MARSRSQRWSLQPDGDILGDIPGLLRIPARRHSAAYKDRAFAMTKNGSCRARARCGMVFSAIGGLFGTAC